MAENAIHQQNVISIMRPKTKHKVLKVNKTKPNKSKQKKNLLSNIRYNNKMIRNLPNDNSLSTRERKKKYLQKNAQNQDKISEISKTQTRKKRKALPVGNN